MRKVGMGVVAAFVAVILFTGAPAVLAGMLVVGMAGAAIGGTMNTEAKGRDRWTPQGIRSGYRQWTQELRDAGKPTPGDRGWDLLDRGADGARSLVDRVRDGRHVEREVPLPEPLPAVDRDVLYGRLSELVGGRDLSDKGRALVPDEIPVRSWVDDLPRTPAQQEAYDKAKALRESGYTGWINENGDAESLEDWKRRHGWYGIGGAWLRPDGTPGHPPEGFAGSDAERRLTALRRSGYGGPVDSDGHAADLEDMSPAQREIAQQITDGEPIPDPWAQSVPATTPTTQEEPVPPVSPLPTRTDVGSGGRASIAGLVMDWESSVEARQHPETFIAWLQAQAQAARHRAQMVPDLVQQFHGRGPSGHAGVPESQIEQFTRAYEESATAEADAYEGWARDYAAYVEAAEQEMTHSYGAEVIRQAHDAHSDSHGSRAGAGAGAAERAAS